MKSNGSLTTRYSRDMRRVNDLLSDIYTPVEASEWLVSEHKLLGGAKPADLIAEGRTAEVERLIVELREFL